MKTLWPVLLICLAVALSVNAGETAPDNAKEPARTNPDAAAGEPNEPNELWWKKWDIPVKNPNDANELLRAKWDAVVTVLQNKDLDQKTKEKIIDKVVSPIFNFPLMAMGALGETHWAKLTPPQREKFTSLFTKRLKDSYRENVSLYKDEQATFKPAVPDKTAISIPMELTSGGKDTGIIYRLRKAGPQKTLVAAKAAAVAGDWKIYDVRIEGVSIVVTYRSEFDDILLRGTVDDLLTHLEKPLAPPPNPPRRAGD